MAGSSALTKSKARGKCAASGKALRAVFMPELNDPLKRLRGLRRCGAGVLKAVKTANQEIGAPRELLSQPRQNLKGGSTFAFRH